MARALELPHPRVCEVPQALARCVGQVFVGICTSVGHILHLMVFDTPSQVRVLERLNQVMIRVCVIEQIYSAHKRFLALLPMLVCRAESKNGYFRTAMSVNRSESFQSTSKRASRTVPVQICKHLLFGLVGMGNLFKKRIHEFISWY